MVAHGVSRGLASFVWISPGGAKEAAGIFCRPSRGLASLANDIPRACALGYFLSPLRGLYSNCENGVARVIAFP